MITVENLTKKFDSFCLFEKLSFTVDSGEKLVLVGYSGSGKSTLLRILAGYDNNYQGKIKNSAKTSLLVTQQPHLIDEISVIENCLLQGLIEGQLDESKAKQILLGVGLYSETHSLYPYQLSGGQLRRLAFAQALYANPALLFIDEPTSNLDKESSSVIRNCINLYVSSGGTAVIATHDDQLISSASQIISLAR